jgi:hypothetical protein
MSESPKGRMLLSHNFAIAQDDVPEMSRAAFAATMSDGLREYGDITCTLIENPHWIVEVLFDPTVRSPHQVGKLCAQSLVNSRLAQKTEHSAAFHIVGLGGIKTSPAQGPSPTSLQLGEWGVDVIETPSADDFLKGIDWDATIAVNPTESIFKVDLVVP